MKTKINLGTKYTVASGTKLRAPDYFSPLSIPGCVGWFDATDSSTIDDSTDSGRVEEWTDKSGNGNNVTQSTLAAKPYTGRSIGNMPALDFQDAQVLERSDALGLSGNPDITMIAFVEFDAITNKRYLQVGPNTSGNGIALLQDNSIRFSDGRREFTTPSTGTPYIIVGRRNSGDTYGDSEMRENRSELSETGNSNPTLTPTVLDTAFSIGSAPSLDNTGDLAISEVLIYDTRLSDEQLAKIESYLWAKYLSYQYEGEFTKGSYFKAVMDTNPVRYYRMRGDDTAEATEPDMSVNDQDLTHDLLSDPAPVSPHGDIERVSREYTGVDNGYSTAAALSEINGSTTCTVSAWVFNRDIANDHAILAAGTSTGSDDLLLLWYNNVGSSENGGGTTDLYTFLVGNSTGANNNRVNSQDNAALQGVWQHVTATMNGSTRKIYVDGALSREGANASSVTTITQNDPLWIGATDAIAAEWDWDGYISDVVIWDRELSATEIANLYKAATVPNIIVTDGNDPFSWSSWSQTSCSITTSYGTAPDGSTGANGSVLIQSTRGGPFDSTNYDFDPIGGFGESYCFSVYLKQGNTNVVTFQLRTENPGSTRSLQDFNFTTGQFTGSTPAGSASNRESGVEDCGGGWYRVWVSGDCVHSDESSEDIRCYIYPSDSGTVNIGDNVEAWYPQLHVGEGPPRPTLDPRNFPKS